MTATHSAPIKCRLFSRHAIGSTLACLFVLSTLAGCGAARDGVRLPNATTTVAPENALALPQPGGPAVVDIVEHRFSNATQQDIYLFTSAATSGQNALRVKLYGPVGLQLDSEKSLAYSSIKPGQIAREIRSEFPGVALATSPLYLQNNYGPFGYASGRGKQNDTCLYAWQQIRSPQSTRTAFQNRGTIQVRLRLCEEGASEEKLLAVMYGYTINAAFSAAGWNPYGDPPAVDASLGRTGSPIYPAVAPSPAPAPQTIAAERPIRAAPRQQRKPDFSVRNPRRTARPDGEATIPLPIDEDIDSVVVPPPPCVAGAGSSAQCM